MQDLKENRKSYLQNKDKTQFSFDGGRFNEKQLG